MQPPGPAGGFVPGKRKAWPGRPARGQKAPLGRGKGRQGHSTYWDQQGAGRQTDNLAAGRRQSRPTLAQRSMSVQHPGGEDHGGPGIHGNGSSSASAISARLAPCLRAASAWTAMQPIAAGGTATASEDKLAGLAIEHAALAAGGRQLLITLEGIRARVPSSMTRPINCLRY